MLTSIVGTNWGDEGKGRMVDLLSSHYEIVVRYQGGNNAGHTVVNEKGKFIMNLLPSGILRENTVNILGPGIVIDLEHLAHEMGTLQEKGIEIKPGHLLISDRATICMPYHKLLDGLEEDRLGDKKFGSTRRGISPVYADKYMKKAIRIGDLRDIEGLADRLAGLIEWKNLTVEKGERLSVVGLNGAGKTTLIKLLCRLYDPTEGQILLDGTDIREYDYAQYMKQFSPVFQDFKLFGFSVCENITLKDRENLDEKDRRCVSGLLKQAGLDKFAEKLDSGEDTKLFKYMDEEGIEPSGGEQQKLALARALYKDAPVIILDEPTAALDPVAEYEIYKQFNSLIQDKTAFYISHRLSSCRFCDHIAVFSEGRVAEYGTHEELVNIPDGIYAGMFEAQAQYYR